MVNALGCEVRRIFLHLHGLTSKKKEETKKRKKEKKKINKRKKGDRKTAPPYIFSSPKVEEKISVEAGVRARVRKKAYLFAFLCFRIIIKGFYAF